MAGTEAERGEQLTADERADEIVARWSLRKLAAPDSDWPRPSFEPGVSVATATRHAIPCGGPVERFSAAMPVMPASAERAGADDLLPIDILYGRYSPTDSSIEIFVRRIESDARRLGLSENDLLTIVRMHEHAHAVVHLGVAWHEVRAELDPSPPAEATDWGTFRSRRDRAFSALDDAAGELLAQAIAWAAIFSESNSADRDRLVETFERLESRQPSQYKLPPEVKRHAAQADWSLVLGEVQGDELPPFRAPDAPVLERLIVWRGEHEAGAWSADAEEETALTQAALEIQRNLAAADLCGDRAGASGVGPILKALVIRSERVELRMYKEQNHARPHFHIEYKREFEASYALDTFERLASHMPAKYERAIIPVARARQAHLLACWNGLNHVASGTAPAAS